MLIMAISLYGYSSTSDKWFSTTRADEKTTDLSWNVNIIVSAINRLVNTKHICVQPSSNIIHD